jgi:uncharacterized protein (DUF1697 family)
LSKKNSYSYAAFLRGINVGGNKQIKMDALREAFQSWGFEKTATMLASGNILFDAFNADVQETKQQIVAGIKTVFGFDTTVFVRTIDELKTLAGFELFKDFPESAQSKNYITFLGQKAAPNICIPYQTTNNELRVISLTEKEIFSVVTVTPGYGTTDMMAYLEKEFGGELTTRSWNTVAKMLDLYKKMHP